MLVVDKPRSLTSHDVVNRVRRQLGTRRVGHIGTLDPMATGVLPLVVGRATRLASLLSGGPKVYDAVICLGVVTDTYDATGSVVTRISHADPSWPAINRGTVERAARAFVGTIHQRPPSYSAKKVGGIRAYRLARRHKAVEMSPVTVTVHELKIDEVESDRVRCHVTCSPGFYMRSLAHDLGAALGCGGHLEALRRQRSGNFGLDSAIALDTIERQGKTISESLLLLEQLLPDLPSVVVTARGARRAAHGNVLMPTDVAVTTQATQTASNSVLGFISDETGPRRVKVFDGDGTLLAIAEFDAANILRTRIVLV